MKKKNAGISIMLVLCVFVLSSCLGQPSLVGKWRCKGDSPFVIEFRSDGTYKRTSVDATEETGKWILDKKQMLTLMPDGIEDVSGGLGDFGISYNILKLERNIMVCKFLFITQEFERVK